ncbi:MAG TPA: alpha/beta hydrolase-fold protein [Candidatus Angelobacter sp.]
MSRVLTPLILFALAAALTARPQDRPKIAASPRAHDVSFHSASLGRDMQYRVLLPAGYERNALRYPVLYLLHGAWGGFTDWTRLTHIADGTDSLPLIVVMPDAENSWYINSGVKPQDRYEDYVANDLIAEIDSKYRTVSARRARAIAGISMGGYGAVLLGLKYPGRFSFVGSFGGALAATQRDDEEMISPAFGPPGSSTRAANDVLTLAQKKPARELPYFWLQCGTGDDNTTENRPFVAILEQRKIAHNYMESPGGHKWPVWDAQLPAMLSELSRHTELAAKPAATLARRQKKSRPAATQKPAARPVQ